MAEGLERRTRCAESAQLLRGVYSGDVGDTLMYWWTGSGGYAGLTYFALAEGASLRALS